MNICFIACFEKTIFFKKIADAILERSPEISISWISTSPKWTKFLAHNGTPEEKITTLYKSKKSTPEEKDKAVTLIRKIEESNKKCINFAIQSDRVVKHWKKNDIENYITNCITTIDGDIENRKIDIIFGEATALHEVLAALICKSLDIKFLKPHTVRIPSDRFAFFEGYLEEKIHSRMKNDEEDILTLARDTIERIKKQNLKPNYFYKNNKPPSFLDISLIKRVLKKLPQMIIEQKHNGAEKSLYHHIFIEKKYLTPFRAKRKSYLRLFSHPKSNEKHILFTLHKQPEASIDVLCTEHSNQIELIRRISLNTPRDYKIYVKEHSNAIGERPNNFLNKINKIPNVRLISPHADSHELIRNANLTITISGTVAYEAAIFEKPSATLSPLFFNKFESCRYIERTSDIYDILNEKHHPTPPLETLATLLKDSYSGIISDPVSFPECIDDKNIAKVTSAFMDCIYGTP
ncbi:MULTISPECIES: hypothetical protein [unclassified Pseudomonas]|uniref:hypothetical protein n=1 Tax=unclassified Pseudomonas TaxID=196821 RepID=UPI000A9BAD3E|nr:MULTISPECIES: hypothetical protein [unclassified Pseudomonas]